MAHPIETGHVAAWLRTRVRIKACLMLIVSLLAFALVVGIAIAAARIQGAASLGVIFGAHACDSTEVAAWAAPDAEIAEDEYVRIEYDGGVITTILRDHQREYSVLRSGDTYFILLAPPQSIEPGEIDGLVKVADTKILTPIVRSEGLAEIEKATGHRPRVAPVVIEHWPHMQRTTALTVLITGIMALGCLWFTANAVLQIYDPRFHPSLRPFTRSGDLDELIADFEREMAAPHYKSKRGLHLTENWLYFPTAVGLRLIYLPNLAWAYLSTTTQSVNFIPVSKSHIVDYHDCFGQYVRIPVWTKKGADEVLAETEQRAPWAVYGYSPENQREWNKSRPAFIAAAADRYSQMRG